MENKFLTRRIVAYLPLFLLIGCLEQEPLELPHFTTKPFAYIVLNQDSVYGSLQHTLQPNNNHPYLDSSHFLSNWHLTLISSGSVLLNENINKSISKGLVTNTSPDANIHAEIRMDGLIAISQKIKFPSKPVLLGLEYNFLDTLYIIDSSPKFKITPSLDYSTVDAYFRITYRFFDENGVEMRGNYFQDILNLCGGGPEFAKPNERELKQCVVAYVDAFSLEYDQNFNTIPYSRIEICIANISQNHISFIRSLYYPEGLDYLYHFPELTYNSFDEINGFFGLYNDTCVSITLP